MSHSTEFVTFYLAGNYFGISASKVLELNRNFDVTSVPKSQKIVSGIMNLRGQLVPAINMYESLKLEAQDGRKEAIAIILQCAGFLAALLVDDVGEILSLEEDTFEPPPSNLSIVSKEFILGVHKLPTRLLLILDPNLIIQRPEKVAKNSALLAH